MKRTRKKHNAAFKAKVRCRPSKATGRWRNWRAPSGSSEPDLQLEEAAALKVQMARDWHAIVVDHLGIGWVWLAVEFDRHWKPSVVSIFIADQCEGKARRSMARNFHENILRKIALSVAEDLRCFDGSDKVVMLPPLGMRARGFAFREINEKTPRRAPILGSPTWLVKQTNLIEFTAAADQLLYKREIELWVVGKVPDHLSNNHFLATRFLGFVAHLVPIFRSARIGIVAERTGGGFKLKTVDYSFNRVPIDPIPAVSRACH
jgi:hypothetical protein